MKNLLFLFAIILSANTFAQEPEDDTNFDSVQPFYFLDSIYIKYNITKRTISRDVISDIDWMSDMLYENVDIRIASDEDLSMLLSDSISRLFHASQEFNDKIELRAIYNFIDGIAIDSNLNVLYVRVMSTCQPCMNSIIDDILGDKDMVTLLTNGRLKYVYVNYFQTARYARNEFIVLTVKHWFKRKETYIVYNEKD
jgi:hypothetical protein